MWNLSEKSQFDLVKPNMDVSTIRDKSIFYSVLVYLEEYMVILLHKCENGIERILPHPSLELNGLEAKFFVGTIE